MKAAITCFFVALLLCMPVVQAKDPDSSKSGSHSHMFEYVFEFYPGSNNAAAHFKATLTNITDKDLQVMVNDKAFHSALEITSKSDEEIELFIEHYRTLLLTSTWSEPIVSLPSKKSIDWEVPLSSLLTLHGKPVTHDFLAGRQVVSEMAMAVIPKAGSFISSNALQRSNPIIIPPKG
ncbi:hypothetical protein [Rubellicoccus peritrichatus]|uniref:Uncharacterized protein n=1 Tax=Rubellicoccus peritrichatus TaxID=3080537 RepID=A0AAQ3QXN3_9BACT|nr:hypothetical protein [Puniceicoccus sp. CR14]WOO43217.1 hypothetical protein RZN69_08935 [Puniceicoccus sp. CR14]